MNARVVILGGAGAMGRITATDLFSSSRDLEVVVADREEALARAGNLPPCARQAVDVTDPSSLHRALDGAFAVIASLPYRFNLLAMQGALEARCHYIDLGGLFHMTRRQLGLSGEFERSGLMAILGMGSAPGIVNLLAVHAARDMSVVQEVHCLVGAADRTRFKSAPPLGFGYSVDTLLDEFAMPSAVFRKGAFTMVAPLDPRERRMIQFPSPIGRLAVDTTLHSEVATLPGYFAGRGVREVTFRQGFDAEFMEKLAFLVSLGLTSTDPIRVPGASGDHNPPIEPAAVTTRPAQSLAAMDSGSGSFERVLPALRSAGSAGAAASAGSPAAGMVAALDRPAAGASEPSEAGVYVSPRRVLLSLLGRFPPSTPSGKPARYEVLRALVRGKQGRRAVTVAADCLAGPRSGRGIGPDVDTGAPPSIVVQMMLAGTMTLRPGVWAPEQVVPVEPFLRALERRGMRVTRRAGRSLPARVTKT